LKPSPQLVSRYGNTNLLGIQQTIKEGAGTLLRAIYDLFVNNR